jgi:hypothetical protein
VVVVVKHSNTLNTHTRTHVIEIDFPSFLGENKKIKNEKHFLATRERRFRIKNVCAGIVMFPPRVANGG